MIACHPPNKSPNKRHFNIDLSDHANKYLAEESHIYDSKVIHKKQRKGRKWLRCIYQ